MARRSIRQLFDYLAKYQSHQVVIGREFLRALLAENDVTFQRTKTWKESNDPLREEELDRFEEVARVSLTVLAPLSNSVLSCCTRSGAVS